MFLVQHVVAIMIRCRRGLARNHIFNKFGVRNLVIYVSYCG